MNASDHIFVKCPHCGFKKQLSWAEYEFDGFSSCYKCHRRIPVTAEAWPGDPDLQESFDLARKPDLDNAKADELAQKILSGEGCSKVLLFGGVFVTLAIKFGIKTFSA